MDIQWMSIDGLHMSIGRRCVDWVTIKKRKLLVHLIIQEK